DNNSLEEYRQRARVAQRGPGCRSGPRCVRQDSEEADEADHHQCDGHADGSYTQGENEEPPHVARRELSSPMERARAPAVLQDGEGRNQHGAQADDDAGNDQKRKPSGDSEPVDDVAGEESGEATKAPPESLDDGDLTTEDRAKGRPCQGSNGDQGGERTQQVG